MCRWFSIPQTPLDRAGSSCSASRTLAARMSGDFPGPKSGICGAVFAEFSGRRVQRVCRGYPFAGVLQRPEGGLHRACCVVGSRLQGIVGVIASPETPDKTAVKEATQGPLRGAGALLSLAIGVLP